MSDEERPPAPPLRVTSAKDSSPASKPLPSAPVDEKKKKKASTSKFLQYKGDEKCM